MKIFSRCFLIGLIASSVLGCQDWIEEQRQENYRQCTQACSSVFASYPSHYTMCMNAGLQSDGYYNGPACHSYVAPHLYCMGAGYHFPKPGHKAKSEVDNAYSDCVTSYQQKQLDQRFTREQTQRDKQLTTEQTCYQENGHTRCVTKQQ